MTENAQAAPERVYYVGLTLTAISFIVFCIPLLLPFDSRNYFALFCINFLIAIVYFFYLRVAKHREYMPVFLVMFLISAYSLNRSISIFETSADWLSAALVVYSINYVALPFIDALPILLRRLMAVLLGGALVLFIYLTLYLLPLSPFSIIGCFVFGISLHGLVPVFIVIYTVRWLFPKAGFRKYYALHMASGAGLSLLVVALFAWQWHSVNEAVARNYRKTLIADNTDLPGWLKVAQNIPDTWLTRKYLKGDLVYTVPDNHFFDFDWRLSNKNFDEGRRHDPLVFIASLFSIPPEMDLDDRIKILTAMYANRHQTEDRLWNGANLRTRSIITNARIWPAQRLAYTEKIITVQNSGTSTSRWDREEAIYTFHLPEGGVVTSLSLWIDGKEQKGLLTAAHKADSAYKQIVGVEQHDPSLVHWHEGNTVSVRVFPVSGNTTRIFKIGITAPLALAGKQLLYDNIWFQGPDCTGAKETQQIDWEGEPKGFSMPDGFTQNGAHRYIREEHTYDPDFRLEFDDPGLNPETFSFDGRSYSVQPYAPSRQPVAVKKVYLDLNDSWTERELEQVYAMVKDKDVFVCNESLIALDEDQMKKGQLTNALLHQRFSLFPFFEITDPATSLVITKSPLNSPNLADLKGTDFASKLEQKMQGSGRIRLFNIGSQLSPYLKTLKEHRSFDYEQGDMASLKNLLESKVFAVNMENDSQVVIDNAGIILASSKGTVHSRPAGPDHLMRLFAYNHIMSELHNKLSSYSDADTALVSEAEKAYIVTPVSSLIVLESQRDYDRFNIKKSSNTLDDATLKSNGAVPEPGEWALIILAVATLAWVTFRKPMQKKHAVQ